MGRRVVWTPPLCGCEGGGDGGSCIEIAEIDHLQLAFRREGGDSGGRRIEMPKITTSGSRLDAREVEVVGVASKLMKRTTGSRLEAREVEVVGDASKRRKTPPPARVWIRGRRWWWVTCRKKKENTTSGSRLDVSLREVVVVVDVWCVERTKKTASGSRLDAREAVVVVGDVSKVRKKNHLQLAFGREGGGDGGWRVETMKRTKNTTSGSRLDAREAVVVGDMSKVQKKLPPARIWMRGRW